MGEEKGKGGGGEIMEEGRSFVGEVRVGLGVGVGGFGNMDAVASCAWRGGVAGGQRWHAMRCAAMR